MKASTTARGVAKAKKARYGARRAAPRCARRSIATASLLGSAIPTAEPPALGMAALSVPADAGAPAATPAGAVGLFDGRLADFDFSKWKLERKCDDQFVLSRLHSVSDSDGDDTPATETPAKLARFTVKSEDTSPEVRCTAAC